MTSPRNGRISITSTQEEELEFRSPHEEQKKASLQLPLISARTDVSEHPPSSPSGPSQLETARDDQEQNRTEKKTSSSSSEEMVVKRKYNSAPDSPPLSPQTISPRSYSFPSCKMETTEYDNLAREGGFRRHFLRSRADACGISPLDRPKCWEEPLTVSINWNEATPFMKFGGLTSNESFVHQNSTFVTAVSIFKAMVCSAIMLTPAATAKGGYVFVCMCYPLFGLACLTGVYLIVKCLDTFATNASFADLCYQSYGKWGSRMLNFSIAMSQTCFCAMYLIFIAENVPVIAGLTYDSRYFQSIEILTLTISTVLFIPITWIKDIHNFSIINEIGSAGILFTIIVFIGGSIRVLIENGVHQDAIKFEPDTWPRFLGVASYTFEGLAVLIPIYQAMHPLEKECWMPLFSTVLLAIMTLLMGVGVLGYLAFGPEVRPIALESLPDSWLKTFTQVVYLVALLCSLPLQYFPVPMTLEASDKWLHHEPDTEVILAEYVLLEETRMSLKNSSDGNRDTGGGQWPRSPDSPAAAAALDRGDDRSDMNNNNDSPAVAAALDRGDMNNNNLEPLPPMPNRASPRVTFPEYAFPGSKLLQVVGPPSKMSTSFDRTPSSPSKMSSLSKCNEYRPLKRGDRMELMRRIEAQKARRREMDIFGGGSLDSPMSPVPRRTGRGTSLERRRGIMPAFLNFEFDYRFGRTTYVICMASIAFLTRNTFIKFVGLVGALLCVPIMIIYPALIHLRLVARHMDGARGALWVFLDTFLALFGVSTTIFAVVVTVSEISM